MKKILSLFALFSIFIFQFHSVYAAPFYAGIAVPGGIIGSIGGFRDTGVDNIQTSLEGEGTNTIISRSDITAACQTDGDPNNTTDYCPYSSMTVPISNTEDVSQNIYICYEITISGTFPDNPVGSVNSLIVQQPLPMSGCFQDTDLAAGTTRNYVLAGEQLFGSVGTEGAAFAYHYLLVVSFSPIDLCSSKFLSVTSDTYDIIPTVEVPLGPSGDPVDNQIYTTTTGQYYKISVDGGPWNDGTTDRAPEDTAVSWDGVTWIAFNLLPSACMTSDSKTKYVQAESDTFYIRVNDTPGAFGDNTNNPDPVTYTIDLVTADSVSTCESQYTYDSESDTVGFTGVSATNADGVLGNNSTALVVGDWYVVRWDYGVWQDDGVPPDRTDLQYKIGSIDWQSLASGGTAVWCVSSNGLEVLFQASDINIYLRVNNESGDFSTNTGNPFYTVLHVTFDRTPESCETTFEVGNLIEHKTVNADQSGGVPFATMVGGDISFLDAGLTPGAWYVLDTTDGPWWLQTHPVQYQYTMAVEEGTLTSAGDWGPLEDWTTPTCNVQIDTLGHRRVIFQMPSSGEVQWKLRVADPGLLNQGSMGWNLYGATKLQDTLPSGGCDYSYDEFDPVDVGEVQANNAQGVPLDGLNPGSLYAIKIVGSGYGWQESFGGTTLYDMQISHNGGYQYYNLPDEYPAGLCHETSGADLIVFVQPGENYNYRLRVESTTFSDNTGKMGYVVYNATAGQTIKNTCLNGYSVQTLNEFDWIDVKSEIGELLTSDTSRYQEFTGLVPGRVYMVETPADQGPWTDGEGNSSYVAALSKDNGETWQPIGFDNTDIDCANRELIGNVWQARFTVQDGDVWKIRVNDTAGNFANNGGNLAYKFYVLCEGMACTGSVPNDSNNIPAISIQGGGNVCSMAIMRPGDLTVSEIFDLGNYIGSWLQYLNLSILRYMAWCPSHTRTFLTFLDKFKTREPYATVLEWNNDLLQIKAQINSYDWGNNSHKDQSIFDQTSSGVSGWISSHFFSADDSVWNGGNIISFNDSSMPPAFYSCGNSFTAILPSSLIPPVCFVSAWFIESSASFWIQLSLDIGAIFMLFGMIKGALQDTIYMMTGVKPWVKGSNRDNWVMIEKEARRK